MFFCIVKFLGLVIFFFPIWLSAQMLDNSKGFAFTELPYFNEKFIQTNRIKSLTGNFQYKKMGETIKNSKYVYQYEFDQKGHLVHSMETRLIGTIVDTLILYYEYDANNRLSVVRQRDNQGFFSTKYTYDNENRVIKEEYFRDIDTTSGNLIKPSFERSTFINSEYYDYQKNQALLKKIYYNNYDFPYMDEYITTGELGLVVKREKVIRTTSQKVTTDYEYNDKGWLSKEKTIASGSNNSNQETVFHYDKQGNLTEKQMYKNGEHYRDIQLIYSTKTGILSYTLTREVKTNFITILKFDKVEYY